MVHWIKQLLEDLAHVKTAGPSPTFSVFHLLVALELMAEKPIGRNKLAKDLGVGEGVIRTIVGRLKDAGMIEMSRLGCSLTDKSVRFWKELSSVFRKVEFGKSELTHFDYSFAILVKDGVQKVRSGMEQRDAAVVMGAKTVTTILFRRGLLVIPSVSDDVAKDFPDAAKQIVGLLKPEENDVIVVGSADDSKKAEYGTLSAAWTLLNNSEKKDACSC